MKSLIVLSFLVASSAFAQPVATIKTSGGHTIRPTTSTLTVDSSGLVSVETVTGSFENASVQAVKKTNVARLNAAVVAAIVNDVAEANNTKIVADDPEAPECTDTPLVSYSVVKDGALVEIGRRMNCKAYFLDDYQARTAMSLLESLLVISRSAQ